MNVDVKVSGLVLGARYRDTMTDFEGVADGVWITHSGHVQVALAYHDGTIPKTVWIDVARIEPVGDRPRPGIAR